MNLIEQIKVNDVSIDGYQGTYYSDNPEWVRVILDSENKVLAGIRADGSVEWSIGIPSPIRDYVELKINSIDFSQIDSSLNDLYSTKVDKVQGKGLSTNDYTDKEKDITNISELIDNIEYMSVETDDDGKILSYTKTDGGHYSYNLHSETIDKVVEELPKKVDSEDGKGLILTDVSESLESFDDTELRSEITTDSNGKILSYRRPKDGVKVEAAGLKTTDLEVENLDLKNNPFYEIHTTLEKDTIYVERPRCGEIWLEGTLPTDDSEERTPTWLKMTFKNSGVPQFICKCTLAILGHGSIHYPKRGYTLEPYNDKDKSISIKFGDIIAADSFHLKAYYTDNLHCRDMANFNIWRDMIKQLDYPYSKFNQIPFALDTTYNKNKDDIADAKYSPDGFPVVCYLNGNFLGLYTIKLKKTRQNYAMEKSVKTEILMDAINYKGFLYKQFDPQGWDVKNPKMKNYEEGGEIPDADVLASITRFFDWTSNAFSTAHNLDGWEDYLNVPHWLVFIILEELIFSQDINNNNYLIGSWDGLHWSVFPYDTDLSVGLHEWESLPPYTAHTILTEADTRFLLQYGLFSMIKSTFFTELKELWTKWRKNGFITPQNIVSYYKRQCECIPRDIYEKDYEKWGNLWVNGNLSIEQMYVFIKNRMEWLDESWLINE